MPSYDYCCEKCGDMEITHRMSETIDECPECGGAITKGIHMGSGFIFNCPGFYGNTYARGEKPAWAGKSKPSNGGE